MPYTPTLQPSGRFLKTRGNTPEGIGERDWILAYNRAHSRLYKEYGNKVASNAMHDGRVRDAAIEDLIKKGDLAADFFDCDV